MELDISNRGKLSVLRSGQSDRILEILQEKVVNNDIQILI